MKITIAAQTNTTPVTQNNALEDAKTKKVLDYAQRLFSLRVSGVTSTALKSGRLLRNFIVGGRGARVSIPQMQKLARYCTSVFLVPHQPLFVQCNVHGIMVSLAYKLVDDMEAEESSYTKLSPAQRKKGAKTRLSFLQRQKRDKGAKHSSLDPAIKRAKKLIAKELTIDQLTTRLKAMDGDELLDALSDVLRLSGEGAPLIDLYDKIVSAVPDHEFDPQLKEHFIRTILLVRTGTRVHKEHELKRLLSKCA